MIRECFGDRLTYNINRVYISVGAYRKTKIIKRRKTGIKIQRSLRKKKKGKTNKDKKD